MVHQLRALQLPTGHHEDLEVDHQHYEQWGQDTPKEIEVHHVAHGDHILKKTPDKAAAFICGSIPGLCAVGGTVLTVPPQEWGQANAKGKDPEHSNNSSGSGPSDQTLVPVQEMSCIIVSLQCLAKSNSLPLLLHMAFTPNSLYKVHHQRAPGPFTFNTKDTVFCFAPTGSVRFSYLTNLPLFTSGQ